MLLSFQPKQNVNITPRIIETLDRYSPGARSSNARIPSWMVWKCWVWMLSTDEFRIPGQVAFYGRDPRKSLTGGQLGAYGGHNRLLGVFLWEPRILWRNPVEDLLLFAVHNFDIWNRWSLIGERSVVPDYWVDYLLTKIRSKISHRLRTHWLATMGTRQETKLMLCNIPTYLRSCWEKSSIQSISRKSLKRHLKRLSFCIGRGSAFL